MTDAPLIDRLARGGLSNSSVKCFPGGASNELQEPTALRSDETAADCPRGRLNQAARLSGSVWTGGRLVTGAPALPDDRVVELRERYVDQRERLQPQSYTCKWLVAFIASRLTAGLLGQE
jgi:hypothetical protein